MNRIPSGAAGYKVRIFLPKGTTNLKQSSIAGRRVRGGLQTEDDRVFLTVVIWKEVSHSRLESLWKTNLFF